MATQDPQEHFPTPGYWGPLARLVQYAEPRQATLARCPSDLLLSWSFDKRDGTRQNIQVPIKPSCKIGAYLKPCRIQVLDRNTTPERVRAPPAVHAALRVTTRPETCDLCGVDGATHFDQGSSKAPWQIFPARQACGICGIFFG